MIRHPADPEEHTSLAPHNPANIRVKLLAQILRNQRLAVFCAEHDMIGKIREG
jgi:hypothetical protein